MLYIKFWGQKPQENTEGIFKERKASLPEEGHIPVNGLDGLDEQTEMHKYTHHHHQQQKL